MEGHGPLGRDCGARGRERTSGVQGWGARYEEDEGVGQLKTTDQQSK